MVASAAVAAVTAVAAVAAVAAASAATTHLARALCQAASFGRAREMKLSYVTGTRVADPGTIHSAASAAMLGVLAKSVASAASATFLL